MYYWKRQPLIKTSNSYLIKGLFCPSCVPFKDIFFFPLEKHFWANMFSEDDVHDAWWCISSTPHGVPASSHSSDAGLCPDWPPSILTIAESLLIRGVCRAGTGTPHLSRFASFELQKRLLSVSQSPVERLFCHYSLNAFNKKHLISAISSLAAAISHHTTEQKYFSSYEVQLNSNTVLF